MTTETDIPQIKTRYLETAQTALRERFGYTNHMAIPRLEKVCLNMGLGQALTEKKIFDQALSDMARIAGQQPVITKARKAVSNFKLREGNSVGARVTLRGRHMYEFMYRLICVALPRVPDFRGLPATGFDGRGNYSMGLKEILVFPEIDPDKSVHSLGMDVTIVTTAQTNDEGLELLRALGFPFQRPDEN